ncbi:MAG: Dph6-related ATP pyrophosphatase [Vulcanimicrobiaceae bacterium]
MKQRVVCSWSGGKDSALALHRLLNDERYEVVALVTTCDERSKRISAHGVRIELAEQQARAIGLPLDTVFLSERRSNEEYREKMGACLLRHRDQGVGQMVFGDIFLEDIRAWREMSLADTGIGCLFPLWKNDSRALIDEFIGLGFGSVICCVRDDRLDEAALGRRIDREFIEGLPEDVDPCGENGEFHSFAYAGPIFTEVLRIRIGATRREPGFHFCDVLSAEQRGRSRAVERCTG